MKRISDGARARQGGAARWSAGARSPRRRTQGGGSVAIATMTAVREFGGGGLKRGGGISGRGGRSRAMRNVERAVGV